MTLDQLSAAATQGEYDKQVQLWFFRELTSDQRLALFKLCGLPVDEIGHIHSHQRLCLKRVLRRTGQLVAVADDAVERVARTLAPNLEGGREFDQMPKDRVQLRQWTAQGMCLINDATQDDATWLAQEAIKAAKGTGDE